MNSNANAQPGSAEQPKAPSKTRQSPKGSTSGLAKLSEKIQQLSTAPTDWVKTTWSGDLTSVLSRIVSFLTRFIVFANPNQPIIVALWIAHTWVFEAFGYTPYLNPFSPEKQCGKSRLLDCLAILVRNPWRTISPSEAVLFRHIDAVHPTLLLDESDTIFGNGKDDRNEPLRALLNAGFERDTATIPRCVGQALTIHHFNVFCPKAFAGIGSLPDTIRSRSIRIRLNRKARGEKVERFRKRDAETEAKIIRGQLEAWSKLTTTIRELEGAHPLIPDQLDDRQVDICEPLLAIAESAGGDWPSAARRAVIELCAAENEDDSLGVKLLLNVRDIFESMKVDRMSSADLLEALINQETDGPWPSWWEHEIKIGNTRGPAAKLARLLKPFSIKPKVIRMADNTTPRGFMRTDFEEAWKRYCPSSENPDATTQQPSAS
jgi:hypothetical protein